MNEEVLSIWVTGTPQALNRLCSAVELFGVAVWAYSRGFQDVYCVTLSAVIAFQQIVGGCACEIVASEVGCFYV